MYTRGAGKNWILEVFLGSKGRNLFDFYFLNLFFFFKLGLFSSVTDVLLERRTTMALFWQSVINEFACWSVV